jgi:hypothetical protein
MSDSELALADQALVMAYPARFEAGPKNTTKIRFPDFPDVEILAPAGVDAFSHARTELRSIVADLVKQRRSIAGPSRGCARRLPGDNETRFEAMVPLDHTLAPKAILADALVRRGISNVRLAQQLGCNEREVRRLLDPDTASRTRLSDALEAVGAHIAITIVDTARPRRILKVPGQTGFARMKPEPVIAVAGSPLDEAD